jgi:hypothetical protein
VLPEEVWIVLFHEVAVESGLSVDGPVELELLDDPAWLQVELSLDDFSQLVIVQSFPDRPIAVHVDRYGVRNADAVGDLNQAPFAKLVMDERFGNPPGCVGS